jgi:anti-sigma factor RsiW
MTCPPFEDLSAYADHMLKPSADARMDLHVHGCATCQRQLEELRTLQSHLRALPAPKPGFDMGARLHERLRAGPVRRPTRRFAWTGWAPAGLAVAALASGAWLGGLLMAGSAASAPRAAMVRVFDPVPPGGLCALTELCHPPKGTP